MRTKPSDRLNASRLVASTCAVVVAVIALGAIPTSWASAKVRRAVPETVLTGCPGPAPAPDFDPATIPSSVAVIPNTALGNQAVTVCWGGFDYASYNNVGSPTGHPVSVYECTEHPVALNHDCLTADSFPSSADGNLVSNGVTLADGTGSVNFEVRTDQQVTQFSCNETTPCSLVVFDGSDQFDGVTQMPPSALITKIQFAHSSNGCPIPIKNDLAVGGEASAANLIDDWAAKVCTGPGALAFGYTTSSSNNGRDNLYNHLADIAVTSLGPQPDELAGVADVGSVRYAPLNLNGIVLAFSVTDRITKQPIANMVLSQRLLTRLITDSQLTGFFTDPEFLALNPDPNVAWPDGGASQPALRGEINADTRIATNWMIQSQDARNLLKGQTFDKYGVRVPSDFAMINYPVDNFEVATSDSGFQPTTGETAVAKHVFYQAKPDSSHDSHAGYIGLMSRSAALRYNLQMASLVTSDPTKPVYPSDAALLAGYKSMRKVNGVLEADPNATDPNAYPLTKIDYAMLRTSVFSMSGSQKVGDPAKAAALKRFLTFAAGAGQQNLVDGYMALPSELVAQTQSVIDAIAPLPDPKRPPTKHPRPATTTTSATRVTDATTPIDNSCCSSTPIPAPTVVATSTPETTTTFRIMSKPVVKTPQLQIAFEAPDWAPTSGVGASAIRYAVPAMFFAGLFAVLLRILWQFAPAFLKFRAKFIASES